MHPLLSSTVQQPVPASHIHQTSQPPNKHCALGLFHTLHAERDQINRRKCGFVLQRCREEGVVRKGGDVREWVETHHLGVGRGVKRREDESRHRVGPFSGSLQLVSSEALCTSQIETTSPSWGEELKASCIVPGSRPNSNSLLPSVLFSFFFPSWFSFLHFFSASSICFLLFFKPQGWCTGISFTNGTFPPSPSPNQAANLSCSVGRTSACY